MFFLSSFLFLFPMAKEMFFPEVEQLFLPFFLCRSASLLPPPSFLPPLFARLSHVRLSFSAIHIFFLSPLESFQECFFLPIGVFALAFFPGFSSGVTLSLCCWEGVRALPFPLPTFFFFAKKFILSFPPSQRERRPPFRPSLFPEQLEIPPLFPPFPPLFFFSAGMKSSFFPFFFPLGV